MVASKRNLMMHHVSLVVILLKMSPKRKKDGNAGETYSIDDVSRTGYVVNSYSRER